MNLTGRLLHLLASGGRDGAAPAAGGRGGLERAAHEAVASERSESSRSVINGKLADSVEKERATGDLRVSRPKAAHTAPIPTKPNKFGHAEKP